MTQSQTSVQIITIDETKKGQRIDNFLLGFFSGLPKSRVYKLLRKGEVRVNKKRIKPDYKLQSGDLVRLPPVRIEERPEKASIPKWAIDQLLSREIYSDEHINVYNKPSGMAVHGGSGVPFGVIDILRDAYPEQKFLELAHRLDRGTSGCLLIAKDRQTLLEIQDLLKHDGLQKIYHALVKGNCKSQVVEVPLKKSQQDKAKEKVVVDKSGKYSKTNFKNLECFNIPGLEASLIEATIETGRTHQIRVHASHIGHPLAGDDRYGDRDFNKKIKGLGVRRLFLHAASLAFQLGYMKTPLIVQAPLDDELVLLLDNIS